MSPEERLQQILNCYWNWVAVPKLVYPGLFVSNPSPYVLLQVFPRWSWSKALNVWLWLVPPEAVPKFLKNNIKRVGYPWVEVPLSSPEELREYFRPEWEGEGEPIPELVPPVVNEVPKELIPGLEDAGGIKLDTWKLLLKTPSEEDVA